MGKQYISTVLAAQAHKLDITGVAITNKYTITVSSDGYANFWDNKQVDVHDPNDHVVKQDIGSKGLHHVACLEKTLGGLGVKVVVVAFTGFDGLTKLFYYTGDDISTWTEIDSLRFATLTWVPAFYNNPVGNRDSLLVSLANGQVSINDVEYEVTDDGKLTGVKITDTGAFNPNLGSFPISLAVLATEDPVFAVGYTNGDVLLCELAKKKIIYSLHSSDLKLQGDKLSSVPRVLEFSPGGMILAVGRDIELAGTISLYDVVYGENIGLLTVPSHSNNTGIGGFAHEGWILGLSFNGTGEFLASCGYDKVIRVWNVDTKEREATITVSITDLEDTEHDENTDVSVVSGVRFINKGIRGGAGGDANDGLVAISFDRGVRWYREAGGI